MNSPAAPIQARPQRATNYLESESRIQIWREAMEHLRHLNDDVWKTFALYLSLDVALLLSMSALIIFMPTAPRGLVVLLILDLGGLVLTIGGRYLFKRHRIYYLQMLAKKTLLELQLGFYATHLADSTMDLSFPWRLTPEVAAEIARDPAQWVAKSIRSPGTMARIQFWILEALLAVYSSVLLFGIYSLLIT